MRWSPRPIHNTNTRGSPINIARDGVWNNECSVRDHSKYSDTQSIFIQRLSNERRQRLQQIQRICTREGLIHIIGPGRHQSVRSIVRTCPAHDHSNETGSIQWGRRESKILFLLFKFIQSIHDILFSPRSDPTSTIVRFAQLVPEWTQLKSERTEYWVEHIIMSRSTIGLVNGCTRNWSNRLNCPFAQWTVQKGSAQASCFFLLPMFIWHGILHLPVQHSMNRFPYPMKMPR